MLTRHHKWLICGLLCEFIISVINMYTIVFAYNGLPNEIIIKSRFGHAVVVIEVKLKDQALLISYTTLIFAVVSLSNIMFAFMARPSSYLVMSVHPFVQCAHVARTITAAVGVYCYSLFLHILLFVNRQRIVIDCQKSMCKNVFTTHVGRSVPQILISMYMQMCAFIVRMLVARCFANARMSHVLQALCNATILVVRRHLVLA